MKRILSLLVAVVLVGVFGCGETEYVVVEQEKPYLEVEKEVEVEVEVEVLPPPMPPQGFEAWAEDSQSYLEWLPSQDPSVVGYVIYRSTSELEGYEEVAQIDGRDVVSYVDAGLENGFTCYYGITTFDNEGYESEQMNPEIVWATARPEGSEAKLSIGDDGFDFGLVTVTDGWFCLQEEDNTLFLDPAYFAVMQDMGYTDSLYDVWISPIEGFIPNGMRVIEGHTYVFRMLLESGRHRYAKIRISGLGEEAITFDWAVQLQPNNPELAPRRDSEPLVKQWGAVRSK